MITERTGSLCVRVNNNGLGPTPWAWAIYQGSDRFLILQSRDDYASEIEAYEAGRSAACGIARRLGVEVESSEAAVTKAQRRGGTP